MNHTLTGGFVQVECGRCESTEFGIALKDHEDTTGKVYCKNCLLIVGTVTKNKGEDNDGTRIPA